MGQGLPLSPPKTHIKIWEPCSYRRSTHSQKRTSTVAPASIKARCHEANCDGQPSDNFSCPTEIKMLCFGRSHGRCLATMANTRVLFGPIEVTQRDGSWDGELVHAGNSPNCSTNLESTSAKDKGAYVGAAMTLSTRRAWHRPARSSCSARDGISRNEIEDAKSDHLEAGCNILLRAMQDRAKSHAVNCFFALH